jgi:hypothetical protein
MDMGGSFTVPRLGSNCKMLEGTQTSSKGTVFSKRKSQVQHSGCPVLSHFRDVISTLGKTGMEEPTAF